MANVYKKQGIGSLAKDRLHFAYHITWAIIENDPVTLTDDDIVALVQMISNADKFIPHQFSGKYFWK